MPLKPAGQGPPPARLQFPPGFLWGVSTSAHQVEGGNENQWSWWERQGNIRSGEACGLACDWWNGAEQDFDLAAQLGLNALRLSVEWSRIEPRPGEWDAKPLERYRCMLGSLRERNIVPIVCLHHFTHPLWFENAGGFVLPDASERFERFTRRVVEALGDLCSIWVTFNEPNVYSGLGYVLGEFPPGRTGDLRGAIRALSGMGAAHARAYRAIHELQPDAHVGFAHNYLVFHPARRFFPLDVWVAAMQRKLFDDAFLQLLARGRLPFPFHLADGSFREPVQRTYDFVGLNVYSRMHVAFDLRFPGQLFGRVFVPHDVPQGDHGVHAPYGEAYPQAISEAVDAAASLGKPIYILENGVPDAQDRIRPWLLVNAIREVHNLLAAGRDVRGYFHWTLTDNFEWTQGWRLRFGLFELEPQTQRRTPRPSAAIYSEIARSNSVSAELIKQYSSPTA